MSEHAPLIDRYIAAWNEADAERRRDLIAGTWTETATYVDPLMSAAGHDGINAMIQGVQARFPDFRFSLTAVDGYGDRVRFSWALGPAGVDPVVEGTDFARVSDDRRLSAVTGFLDKVPAAA
ncbi:polyketide cyclase [Caulobacter sp. CCUG 60055]|uniref:nuclear transport factor 2 family protein n=1 Tax=Caulobacter sp. CCUG 60055 TaxID=2100090 RepID=UPI001FA7E7E6|nr:nuclear transport factor 2 family protein [Caulobacter sp. CCUG 60055]MCI3182021.1 polyketide cyclase [Caulobacter sp. CCUG 60055]